MLQVVLEYLSRELLPSGLPKCCPWTGICQNTSLDIQGMLAVTCRIIRVQNLVKQLKK
jgi:hypothetical protein